jgi:hypothetical protein
VRIQQRATADVPASFHVKHALPPRSSLVPFRIESLEGCTGKAFRCAIVRLTAAQGIAFFRRYASQWGTCPFSNRDVHFCLDAKTNQKHHGGRRKCLTSASAPLKFFKLVRVAHSGSEEFPSAPPTQQSGRHFLRRPERLFRILGAGLRSLRDMPEHPMVNLKKLQRDTSTSPSSFSTIDPQPSSRLFPSPALVRT